MLAKLTSKNQLTVPKAILKPLPQVDYFEVAVKHHVLQRRPVEVRPVRGTQARPQWPAVVERVMRNAEAFLRVVAPLAGQAPRSRRAPA